MTESDDRPGLWYGLVSIQTTPDTVYHHFGHGMCQSGAEFMGLLLKRAREKHPQGPIINTAYYRVSDDVVRAAATACE